MSCCTSIGKSIEDFGDKFSRMTTPRKTKTILIAVGAGAVAAIGIGVLLGLTVGGRAGLGVGLLTGAAVGTGAFVVLVNRHTKTTQELDRMEAFAQDPIGKTQKAWNKLWR